jgi:rhodanese-related sulfurtransferase
MEKRSGWVGESEALLFPSRGSRIPRSEEADRPKRTLEVKMKRILESPSRLLSLAVTLTLVGCGQGQREGKNPGPATNEDAPLTEVRTEAQTVDPGGSPGYRDISVEELRTRMTEGDPFLVNVHIPFEGDIPGTDESIRFDRITEHLNRLPRDRSAEIVLYCRSDRMSEEAGAALASLGYTNVFNLDGGFRAWEAAGYEIER